MSEMLSEIKNILSSISNEDAKATYKKFVPGNEKVYGVRTPVLNRIAKDYKTGGFILVKSLWEEGSVEEKILAAKMLGLIAKTDPPKAIRMIQFFAKNIGNWAVCDTIGMQSLKQIVKTHQKEIFTLAKGFNNAPDFWQRRLSLVLVEWFTRIKLCHPEIKLLINNLQNDKEYYVKKAIVWVNKNFERGK